MEEEEQDEVDDGNDHIWILSPRDTPKSDLLSKTCDDDIRMKMMMKMAMMI